MATPGYGIAPHGVRSHANVTRKLFVSPGACVVGNNCSQGSDPIQLICTDGALSSFGVSFMVPSDFVSATSLKFLFLGPEATGNVYWREKVRVSREDTALSSETTDWGVTTVSSAGVTEPHEASDPPDFSSIAQYDVIAITFQRDASDALDTLDETLRVYGVIFEYTAEQ